MTVKETNIFDFLYDKLYFDINKPIRLFEAFSGIGTQAMALKRLGYQVDYIGISEIDKHALKSYYAIHGEVKNYGGIGSFERMPKDIDICSWSFPCQDISLAGKQRGMVDGSRSNYGYIFLDTIENTPYEERPKVLLMENVKALLSKTFSEDWKEINLRLERLGYKNYADSLIATDFGVPQTRDRVFIVSIKGEYSYTFPKPIPLVKRLKDYLEDEVDEKYYLSDKMIDFFVKNSEHNKQKGNGFRFTPKKINDINVFKTITTRSGSRMDDNFIIVPEATKQGYSIAEDGDGMPKIIIPEQRDTTICINSKVDGKQPSVQDRIYDSRGVSTTITTSYHPNILIWPEATKKGYILAEEGDGVYLDRPHPKRGVVQKDKIQTIKTSVNDIGVVVKETENYLESNVLGSIDNLRIRKLTPLEAWRLMGIDDEDFYKAKASGMSDSQLYKQAGNAIVVDVLYYIFKQFIKGERK